VQIGCAEQERDGSLVGQQSPRGEKHRHGQGGWQWTLGDELGRTHKVHIAHISKVSTVVRLNLTFCFGEHPNCSGGRDSWRWSERGQWNGNGGAYQPHGRPPQLK